MRKGLLEKSRYAFYGEGPTWTITYDGRTIRGLKGNGFAYIYYLLLNKGKVFHTTDLVAEVEKLYPNWNPQKPKEEYDCPQTAKEKPTFDYRSVSDDKTRRKLQDRVTELKQTIEEAETTNDLGRKESAREELERILDHIDKSFGMKGQSRDFRDDSTRIKDRITKSIERAVKKLRHHDKHAGLHFRNALHPINSFEQSYRPATDIDWLLN